MLVDEFLDTSEQADEEEKPNFDSELVSFAENFVEQIISMERRETSWNVVEEKTGEEIVSKWKKEGGRAKIEDRNLKKDFQIASFD